MTTPSLKLYLMTGVAAAVAAFCVLSPARGDDAKADHPVRALLLTGGSAHDYNAQKITLPEGISARAKVKWTVFHEGGTAKNHRMSIFDKPDWADGYDVVVHNVCFAQVTDREYIERILAAHRKGTGAVVIHCAMHTFRDLKTDEWREFLGVTSRRHGPQQPLEVKNLMPDHPIMKGFPSIWTTGKEELYVIEKVWPHTVPLAQAYALDNKKDHPVIWTNTYGKGKVFGTTLVHHDHTMHEAVYLDLMTRGLLWACDKLDADGKPKPEYRLSTSR